MHLRDNIPLRYLHDLLRDNLSRLIRNKASFVHKKSLTTGFTHVDGIVFLDKHLERKTADRKWYVGWLSKLHSLGIKQCVFDKDFSLPDEYLQKRPIKRIAPVKTDNSDHFFDHLDTLVDVKKMNSRKCYGITKRERLET